MYAYEENYKQTHLWKVRVADKTETRITSGDYSVTAYELSDDGKKIAYHRAPTPLLGDGRPAMCGCRTRTAPAPVQVTKNGVPESGAMLSPDNSQVLFLSGSNANFETYYNGRLFVAPAAGGAARVIVGEKEPYDVDSAMWSTDGRSIYFLANLGVHEELFVVPAAGGTPKQLTTGQHAIGALSQSGSRVRLHDQRFDAAWRHLRDGCGGSRAVADHSRLRLSRARLRPRPPGSDHVEGR